jgi:hypothetical protein
MPSADSIPAIPKDATAIKTQTAPAINNDLFAMKRRVNGSI